MLIYVSQTFLTVSAIAVSIKSLPFFLPDSFYTLIMFLCSINDRWKSAAVQTFHFLIAIDIDNWHEVDNEEMAYYLM